MKRIGILGGSFNPPHVAHLIGAEVAKDALKLDTVIFIPASIPPHKQDMTLPNGDMRLRMTEAAIEGNPAFQVSGIELDRTGPSYTIDTLRELRMLYPDAQFVLLIGMDNLEIFHTWRAYDEILRMAELGVMVRPGYSKVNVKPQLLERVNFVEIPLLEISGTDIRHRVKNGLSIRSMVPEPVKRIIEEEALYKDA